MERKKTEGERPMTPSHRLAVDWAYLAPYVGQPGREAAVQFGVDLVGAEALASVRKAKAGAADPSRVLLDSGPGSDLREVVAWVYSFRKEYKVSPATFAELDAELAGQVHPDGGVVGDTDPGDDRLRRLADRLLPVPARVSRLVEAGDVEGAKAAVDTAVVEVARVGAMVSVGGGNPAIDAFHWGASLMALSAAAAALGESRRDGWYEDDIGAAVVASLWEARDMNTALAVKIRDAMREAGVGGPTASMLGDPDGVGLVLGLLKGIGMSPGGPVPPAAPGGGPGQGGTAPADDFEAWLAARRAGK